MKHINSDSDSESIAPTRRVRSPERTARRLSRRRVLRAGGAALIAGLAGCFDGGGAGTASPAGKTTPPPGSVFEEFSFDIHGDRFAATGDLIVRLQSDHQLDTVNLIGPDGSLFASSEVATGATTVRLQVLRVEAQASAAHYVVGEHTLVGARDGEEQTSLTTTLRPNLVITGVTPYRKPTNDDRTFFGNVAVSIENRGSAPTWVYFVNFPDAPNPAVDDEGDPSQLQIRQPNDVREMVLTPGVQREFVPLDKFPFKLRESDGGTDESRCDGWTVTTPIVVGTPVGKVSRPMEAQFAGEASHRFTDDEEYVCTETTFALVDDNGGESSG